MSILPSKDQEGSTSEFQSPNHHINITNHGINSSSSPLTSSQLRNPTVTTTTTTTTTTSTLQSLRIDDPGFSAAASHNFSESLAQPSDDSFGSSEKVNKKSWILRVETSPTQNGHQYLHQKTPSQGNSAGKAVNPAAPATNTGQGTTQHSAAARRSHRVSGNHLLNFHYDPITRSHPRNRAPPPPSRRLPKRKPYNKDLFLQANYKFVVLDTGEYTPESMDPDKMLRWEDIVCLKYLSPFPVRCRICLGHPLCPQITSCGHIFCFPCILQYLLMDHDNDKGESWKRCPLCFAMISSQDLYTIYIENVKQYAVGDIIEFLLLTREKDSYTLSLKNNEGLSAYEEVLDYFSKFTLTSDVDLSVREAMSDLDNWFARADSGLVDDLERLPYVCAAVEQLGKRRKYWNEHRLPDGNKPQPSRSTYGSSPFVKSTNVVHAANEVKGAHSSQSSVRSPWIGRSPPDKANGKLHVVQMADGREQLEDRDGSSSSSYDDSTYTLTGSTKDGKDRDSYSFYQATDGQLIILHSINMKCLLHHYGTYDRLPNRIHGKILQLETVTQSETTRKRFRYLSHLSLTTTFQLCEIDLREMLPANAFSPFIDEIKNREKQRKRLARKEQWDKVKAEAVGLDLVPVPCNVAQSSFDEPTFTMEDFEALGNSNVTSTSSPAFGGRQLFSSVARLGFAAGLDSPALTSEESQPLPMNDVSGAVNGGGTRSFASITSRANYEERPHKSRPHESGKKGRKAGRILLSNAGGRRY